MLHKMSIIKKKMASVTRPYDKPIVYFMRNFNFTFCTSAVEVNVLLLFFLYFLYNSI